MDYNNPTPIDLQRRLHREELLEAEIRMLRQCLRNLSESVIAGQGDAAQLALMAWQLIDGV